MNVSLRYDLRCPADICPVGPAELYEAALTQCEWADQLGFNDVILSEHHGASDGYLPSMVAMGSAIAARTKNLRIRLAAIVAPFYNPLKLAEDLVVLDNLSQGRLDVVLANGYVVSEFEMFDVEMGDRVKLVKEAIHTLKSAWSGEEFEFRGRKVTITPKPFQPNGPSIILGGNTEGAAKRAAQMADAFMPTMPGFYDIYRKELELLGKPDPGPMPSLTGMYFHVARDPEAVWEKVAPHALHEMNSYGQWAAEADSATGYQPVSDSEVLKSMGLHEILTPEQAIERLKGLGQDGQLILHPLMGGLDPELAWENLRLLETEVLPNL